LAYDASTVFGSPCITATQTVQDDLVPSVTHPGGTRLIALLLLLLVVVVLMQMSELTSTLLDAQQQPDELVALLLGKVQLVSSSQLVD